MYEDSDEDDCKTRINSLSQISQMSLVTINVFPYYSVGPMDQHGSVITHLLSQVKLGMDLTKVVLPTFILERRSLLEMYADFFAHPDIFVRY